MTLLYGALGLDVELSDEHPQIIVIEDTKSFSMFVRNLWEQYEGVEGGLSILEKGKEVKINKSIEVIINPFDINCNNKKILSHIQQEVSDIILEEKQIELNRINSDILTVFDEVINKLPYDLEYNLTISPMDLLKTYNLSVGNNQESYLELLIEYSHLLVRACGVKVLISVGLRDYLSPDEIKAYYKEIGYDKLILVDVERSFDKKISEENVLIIDKDQCIICY